MHVKLISLPRTPERLERFRLRNPDLPTELVPGVEGASLSRADLIAQGLITEANPYSAGALGTALSHIGLWRACAAGACPFHIAEDDVILRADFMAAAEAALGRLAAWDIVLWLHNFDWPVQISLPGGVGPVILQYHPDHHRNDWQPFRLERTAPALVRLLSAAGAGCYSVSPRGARTLLAACLPLGGTPARYAANPDAAWANSGLDVEMARHFGDLEAFFALPPLAVAPNDRSASTIRGHLAAMHDAKIANDLVVVDNSPPLCVINLDRTPDRMAAFRTHNPHYPWIERVAAVDGAALDRVALVREGAMTADVPYTSGAIGNALSHRARWEAAVAANTPLTVLEDDAHLCANFAEETARLLATLGNDWDFVQWGYNFDTVLHYDMLPGVTSCAAVFDQAYMRRGIAVFQHRRMTGVLFRLTRSLGIPAYSVSPRGAAKLLKFCRPIRQLDIDFPLLGKRPNFSIDFMMNGIYARINAHVCVPALVLTPNDKTRSTVQDVTDPNGPSQAAVLA